jgi:hypothetical protein
MNNPCASCPWLRANHGKKHGDKWYTTSNLRRLWNGLRTGRAPGMVCHSTDPDSADYGNERPPAPGAKKHECVGATALIQRELDMITPYKDFRVYRREHPDGMTKPGLAHWVNRIVFGGGVDTCEPSADVGLPWRDL